MASPPKEDVYLAEKYEFTFTVAQKSVDGQGWSVVERKIPSLGQAVSAAQSLECWEAAVFTGDGFLYWSSKKPEVFKSTVIQRGQLQIKKFLQFETIRWHAYFQISSKQKVRFMLRRFSEAIEQPVTLISQERHAKDAALFDVNFTSPLRSPDITLATFETLRTCQKIAPQWQITGPAEYDGARWEFKGQAMQPLISKVTWVEFTISNFVYEWAGGKE